MQVVFHQHLFCRAKKIMSSRPQNAFVQLSLAFRNDNYTLETRLKQAERERNLTEENTEKELEEFKNSLKVRIGQNQKIAFAVTAQTHRDIEQYKIHSLHNS